ncbi:hydroxyisourate hydrolase [Arthrobacter sp. MSA 4-2]|uniref:hydroxyisourate hydrolase n=1 Tax=Arthrobacter sp. MSA 4-2 TaxID=2794349 RepID=UPI0018E82369|nr:hydroxyisourate hydrolase [Arthrobacter sp. MSA 4-2]MBJ2119379.1 hydroxyisourate hydrolase [Arthrobacter sp. MSA 4-2]
MSSVSTHVLDTRTGRPAAGMSSRLLRRTGGNWEQVGQGTTDVDGRIKDFGMQDRGPAVLPEGVYRIEFDTGAYFESAGVESFFPEVALTFTVASALEHYHVPLLLSPFAYSTYRGS